MTNYVRQKSDHIHADLAMHAGLLLDQYDGLTANFPSKDKHEATLTLAVLQMLLTNLMELFERLEPNRTRLFSAVIGHTPLWGLEQDFIQQNTFPEPVRLGRVLRHLRNAVSHPTASTKTEWPGSGYTTPHESDLVDAFRFTHSTWVEDGRVPSFLTMKALKRKTDALKKFGEVPFAASTRCEGEKRDA